MKTDDEIYCAYCDEASIAEPYRVLFRHKVKDTYAFQFFQLKVRWHELCSICVAEIKSIWRKR
jgi:hypothetical protein